MILKGIFNTKKNLSVEFCWKFVIFIVPTMLVYKHGIASMWALSIYISTYSTTIDGAYNISTYNLDIYNLVKL